MAQSGVPQEANERRLEREAETRRGETKRERSIKLTVVLFPCTPNRLTWIPRNVAQTAFPKLAELTT